MNKFSHLIAGLMIGLATTFSAVVQADDLDIYTNPALDSIQPPMTVLVLDLNLLDICANIITNPEDSEYCLDLQRNQTVNDLIGGDEGILDSLVDTLLPAAPNNPTPAQRQTYYQNLCATYATTNPATPLVVEEIANSPCLLGLCTRQMEYTFACSIEGSFTAQEQQLSCSPRLTCLVTGILSPVTLLLDTLTFGLLTNLTNGLVGQLIGSLSNHVLDLTLDQLPGTLVGVLGTTLGGLSGILADLDNLDNVMQLIDSIVGELANTRLAIVVSHSDRFSENQLLGIPGSRASSCSFEDESALGGHRQRTTNCSNGAYFLAGFLDIGENGVVSGLLTDVDGIVGLPGGPLANPTSIGEVVTGLLASVLTNPAANLANIGSLVGDVVKTTRNLTAATLGDLPQPQILPPFQGKEVFLEIMQYTGGHAIYNAPLDEWDVLTRPPLLAGRNRQARNLLGGNIEEAVSGVWRYQQPPAECRTVNVLTAELSHPRYDDDSDDRLRELLPNLPAGNFTLDDVIRAAEEDGFDDRNGNKINLRTLRLIQNVVGGLDSVANVGETLSTVLFDQAGLFGEGGTLATWIKPTLEVDASLLTPTLTSDISAPSSLLEPAFFGLFRPDPDGKPRWSGNLKRLAFVDGVYKDSTDADAIDEDGRIKPNVTTFWGPHSLPPGRSGDGRDVSLGGAGSKIPLPGRKNDPGLRKLHFDRFTGGALSLWQLTTHTGTPERNEELRIALQADTAPEADALVLFARGYEVGTKGAPLELSNPTKRDWLHGAVLHSQPVAINYGCTGDDCTPDIRVIYGAQDGFLRMVNNSTGAENWGFIPQTVMKQQKVLRDNNAVSQLPYGVDGSPSVIIQDRSTNGGPGDGVISPANAHDKVWAYFGLRRSGRALYGMNLSNPDMPSLLWRIATNPADADSNPALVSNKAITGLSDSWFAELGLTFSRPQPARLNVDGQNRIVLIFGGGYDTNKDNAGVGTDDNHGNAIFIIDAESGELLWKAVKGTWNATAPYDSNTRSFRHPLLEDSIPADVHVVDMDGDGNADRLYVPDTGGRVWRVDLPGSDRSKWTATPIASVGRHVENAGAADDRRFFHGVDVVPVRGDDLSYDAVVFASGNRERPLDPTTQDALYVLHDTRLGTGLAFDQVITSEADLPRHSDLVDLTELCAEASNENCAPENLTHGWKMMLTASGEKGLSQPMTMNGRVFFSSYVPDSVAAGGELRCEPDEGGSRLYAVSLFDSRGGYFDDADADHTLRTGEKLGVGLPGDLSMAGVGTVRAGTETLEVDMPRFFPIYWRERRGEDERPIPQNPD